MILKVCCLVWNKNRVSDVQRFKSGDEMEWTILQSQTYLKYNTANRECCFTLEVQQLTRALVAAHLSTFTVSSTTSVRRCLMHHSESWNTNSAASQTDGQDRKRLHAWHFLSWKRMWPFQMSSKGWIWLKSKNGMNQSINTKKSWIKLLFGSRIWHHFIHASLKTVEVSSVLSWVFTAHTKDARNRITECFSTTDLPGWWKLLKENKFPEMWINVGKFKLLSWDCTAL